MPVRADDITEDFLDIAADYCIQGNYAEAVNYLDKILDDIIDTLTKMIEPIMLLVIGSIVLVLALALYLPLFQSYLS